MKDIQDNLISDSDYLNSKDFHQDLDDPFSINVGFDQNKGRKTDFNYIMKEKSEGIHNEDYRYIESIKPKNIKIGINPVGHTKSPMTRYALDNEFSSKENKNPQVPSIYLNEKETIEKFTKDSKDKIKYKNLPFTKDVNQNEIKINRNSRELVNSKFNNDTLSFLEGKDGTIVYRISQLENNPSIGKIEDEMLISNSIVTQSPKKENKAYEIKKLEKEASFPILEEVDSTSDIQNNIDEKIPKSNRLLSGKLSDNEIWRERQIQEMIKNTGETFRPKVFISRLIQDLKI